MASKTYENFGNKNNVQKSPLLAARFGRGQVYGQRLANDASGQALWAKDPWFMLGSSIGQAWGDNFNERGIMKGRNEANDALNDYLSRYQTQPQQTQPQQQEQGPLSNAVGVGDATNYRPDMALTDSVAINGDVANGDLVAPMSPQDAYKEYKNQAWLDKYRNPDTPNPTGDAITAKNDMQQVSQMGDNIDFSKVNKEEARAYVRQQLEAKNRTPYQIEQVLSGFDDMYDAKFNKWDLAKGTDLFNQGVDALKKGDYLRAYTNMAAAAEHNNKQAQNMMTYIGNEQRAAAQQQQQDRAYRLNLFKSGLKEDESGNLVVDYNNPYVNGTLGTFGTKAGTGRSGSGRGGGTGNGGGVLGTYSGNVNGKLMLGGNSAVSDKDLAQANKILAGKEGNYSSSDIAWARNIMNKYTSNGHGAINYYDGNDENQVAREFAKAHALLTNTSMSYNQLRQYLRQRQLDRSPYFNQFMEQYGWTMGDEYVDPEARDDEQTGTYGKSTEDLAKEASKYDSNGEATSSSDNKPDRDRMYGGSKYTEGLTEEGMKEIRERLKEQGIDVDF